MTSDRQSPAIALLGLGSNLGDRRATLLAAIESLRNSAAIEVLRVSSFIETEPVGDVHQPLFLNGAVRIHTSLSPAALLDRCLSIEIEYGRDRTKSERWGARTLDIDLLLFGESRINQAGLQVPHPRFHERLFALIPAAEIAGDMHHPEMNSSVSELLDSLRKRGIS